MAVVTSDNGAVVAGDVVAICRPLSASSLWIDVYLTGVSERVCIWFASLQARDDFFKAVVAAMK